MAMVQNRKRRMKRRIAKPKICRLCENKIAYIDFKDAELLKKFQTEKGRILPRRITGTCAHHQRLLTREIKRARQMALLIYTATHDSNVKKKSMI